MFLLRGSRFSFARLNGRASKNLGVVILFANIFLRSSISAQTPQRPHITGISHIAIFAHDYEKSRAFYGQFLGFQEPYSLKSPDGSPSMTFFKINDRQYIELFPEREPNTDRLSHISLETDNIEALRAYLASRGVKVPSKAERGRIGNLSFNITDPEGHTVEMVQYMPEGKTLQARGRFMSDDRVSKRITHVGLIATKLDAEYRFYTDILGFTEFWRGSSTGKVLSWINLKVPDGDDDIELMLSAEQPDPTHRGGAHHLCLQVPDVRASVAALEAKPYFEAYGRTVDPHTGINRKRQANLYDPDGTRIELMEPDTIDGKPTPASTAPAPQ
jgi:lactoylglutathione lyase